MGGGVLDIVLTSLGVGETEPCELESGIDEVVGLGGVGEDGFVGCDRGRSVAGILGEVCFLKAEEIVVGELLGESSLDDEGLLVAGVVAEEEGEDGAGFDRGNGAVSSGFAEERQSSFAVAIDTGDANQDAKPAREAGNGKLLDADGHLGVGVVGVDLEDLFAVATRGITLTCGSYKAVIDEGDEGRVDATCVSTSEVGVGIFGIGTNLLVAKRYGGAGEVFDALTSGFRDGDIAFGAEERVVSVVGGVEEILMV